MLADAGVPDDRPQPPRGRHGVPHRPADGVPRLHRPDPALGDAAAAGAARRGLQHARDRQVAPRPRRRASVAGPVRPLAARVRLRALLRLPPGRHQPLGAAPRARQPLRRAAARAAATATTSPRTSPTRPSAPSPRSTRPRPTVPFFLYFALGAMHAPHHVAPEWVEPYRGAFDGGWEQWRADVFARQLASGRRARGHRARPAPELDRRVGVALAATRSACWRASRRCSPGSSSHTDAQIGRVLAQLDALGELDDTLVMLISDNGASGEGGALGTFNEHRFTEHVPDTVEGNLAWSDELGGLRSYPHYSWGWAWAGNTPLRLWKRYTWLGGTRTPLVVHWPRGIAGARRGARPVRARGRPHAHRARRRRGRRARRGRRRRRSNRSTARRSAPPSPTPTAPSPRSVQYFEMLGSRSIVADGWKATTDHVSKGVVDEERLLEGSRDFADDEWALFHLADDFAETRDLAADHPDVLPSCRSGGRRKPSATRCSRWSTSSSAASPRSCRGPTRSPARGLPPRGRPGARRLGGAALRRVPHGRRRRRARRAARRGSSRRWATGPAASRSFVRDGRLVFVLNRAGDEARVESDVALPPGRHQLAVVYTPGLEGPGVASVPRRRAGRARGARRCARRWCSSTAARCSCSGATAACPVCDDYEPPFPWTGALHELVIETGPAIEPSLAERMRGSSTTSELERDQSTRSRRRGTRRAARRRRRPRRPASRRARGAARRPRRRSRAPAPRTAR